MLQGDEGIRSGEKRSEDAEPCLYYPATMGGPGPTPQGLCPAQDVQEPGWEEVS